MKRDIPSEDYRMTDVQTAIYNWVAEQIASYLGYAPEDIGGIMMDYIKTKPPTIPEKLKNGQLSQRKIDCDRFTYLACLKREGLDPEPYREFLDRLDENVFFVRIPITKSKTMVDRMMLEFLESGQLIRFMNKEKVMPRNLSWTCDRPKCEYRDLCLAELQGLDTAMLIKLNYERSDMENGKEDENESDD
jgi:hypothetical protein